MKRLYILCFLLSSTVAFAQLQFKSGKDGFENFLRENTLYPSYSKQNCIQGTVNIRFKLTKEGNVYSSKIARSVLSELDKEALRLVRLSSGKWAIPSGYDTTATVEIPVNFVLNGFNCENKNKAEIQQAIRYFETQENLTNSIANFYKNIDSAKPGQEAQIIALKNQLGITNEYLDEIISQGLKKIEQGDSEGACESFTFVKNMGSTKADQYLTQYCK
ncbi:energy transducer TonB [Pedobacter sp. MW01-1-1]|uniref:energy transducer TonB n=1 Tax=Pedobacter sp. MW01-1-1 TaxID=3383027 RepID=UPI003FEE5623